MCTCLLLTYINTFDVVSYKLAQLTCQFQEYIFIDSFDFQCRQSCHMQIRTVNFFLFNLCAFYFLFLPQSIDQNFQYYVEKSGECGHLCLYFILGRKYSVCNIKYNVRCKFFWKCSLSSWESSLPFLYLPEFLLRMGVVFCQICSAFIDRITSFSFCSPLIMVHCTG